MSILSATVSLRFSIDYWDMVVEGIWGDLEVAFKDEKTAIEKLSKSYTKIIFESGSNFSFH